MNWVIADIVISDSMNFNNVKSSIITADHDLGELKLNAYQNDVSISHHENEGERNKSSYDGEKEERKNFTLDEKKWGQIVTQNMVCLTD